MPRLTLTTRDGTRHPLEAAAGGSLMQAIRAAGFDEVLALCGGCCSCGTCHVYVEEPGLGRLPAPGAAEAELLECSAHHTPRSRLSCQLPFTETLEGFSIRIAPED